jgi:GNAT superfamily N-acetyltransferase
MTPMAELRPAHEADIPRLMEIRAAVRENRLVSLTIGPDDYRPYIEDARCWAWEDAGVIHGFAALDADTASIWALFVDPACEGRGIGRALLDTLVTNARALGLSALTLETGAGTRAEAFYRRYGFTIVAGGDPANPRMTIRLC